MSLESLRAASNIERDNTWAEISFQERIETAEELMQRVQKSK